MKATFSQARAINHEKVRLICNETQGVYVVTANPCGGFNIFCNGWKFAERSEMKFALLLIQQDAELAVKDAICNRSYHEEIQRVM